MFLTRTRQLVGLDIGSHSVKMVALRPTKGELPFELTHFGAADLPDETIVDGAVVESHAVSQAISELLDQHKVKARNVATSIAGSGVIIRQVTVGLMSADELRNALPFEVF